MITAHGLGAKVEGLILVKGHNFLCSVDWHTDKYEKNESNWDIGKSAYKENGTVETTSHIQGIILL